MLAVVSLHIHGGLQDSSATWDLLYSIDLAESPWLKLVTNTE